MRRDERVARLNTIYADICVFKREVSEKSEYMRGDDSQRTRHRSLERWEERWDNLSIDFSVMRTDGDGKE